MEQAHGSNIDPMYARIGITTSFEAGEQRLSHAYVQAVEWAGGIPVIVPMLETEAACAAFAHEIDALVVTGGPAVTQGLIGDLPADISETDPVRLRADEMILCAVLAEQKPVLGICYGMQLLNALAGGTIYADVQHQIEGALVHSNKRGGEEHAVRIVPGTHLDQILQMDVVGVNTRHIQAVAAVGNGFRVAATAPDGVVEAIERPDGIAIGVQFHPERMENMLPLFQNLAQQGARRRAEAERVYV